jgi:hypothetical protein
VTSAVATRPTAIEVLEVRRLDRESNLNAFVTVRVGALIVHGCRLIQQPGAKPWVSLPQTPGRPKADGTGAGWFPVVEITSEDLMARVRDAVLDAWEAAR